MRKQVVITLLSLVVVLNIGSGRIRRIDHPLSRIESALSEKLDCRDVVEQTVEIERKFKSRQPTFQKA